MKNYEKVRVIHTATNTVKYIPAWITEDEELMKKYGLVLQQIQKKEVSLNVETVKEVQFEEKPKRKRKNNNV